MNSEQIEEGTQVLVILPDTMRLRGAPVEPIPARVVKAARVWLTIERADRLYGRREWRMRRDTQREDGHGYSQNEARFVTAEQWEAEKAARWASEVLRKHSLHVERDSAWPAERRIALATWLEKGEADK